MNIKVGHQFTRLETYGFSEALSFKDPERIDFPPNIGRYSIFSALLIQESVDR